MLLTAQEIKPHHEHEQNPFTHLQLDKMPGAIASEHHLASALGARLLQAGGNAVDACIATALAVGTLNPYHSCIGGGGFAVVRTNDTVETLDFRVTAPVSKNQTQVLIAGCVHRRILLDGGHVARGRGRRRPRGNPGVCGPP